MNNTLPTFDPIFTEFYSESNDSSPKLDTNITLLNQLSKVKLPLVNVMGVSKNTLIIANSILTNLTFLLNIYIFIFRLLLALLCQKEIPIHLLHINIHVIF